MTGFSSVQYLTSRSASLILGCQHVIASMKCQQGTHRPFPHTLMAYADPRAFFVTCKPLRRVSPCFWVFSLGLSRAVEGATLMLKTLLLLAKISKCISPQHNFAFLTCQAGQLRGPLFCKGRTGEARALML